MPEEQRTTIKGLVKAAEEKRDAAVASGDKEAADQAQQGLNEAGKLAGSQ
ncbi:hypothetical protein [Actinophytocola sp.]